MTKPRKVLMVTRRSIERSIQKTTLQKATLLKATHKDIFFVRPRMKYPPLPHQADEPLQNLLFEVEIRPEDAAIVEANHGGKSSQIDASHHKDEDNTSQRGPTAEGVKKITLLEDAVIVCIAMTAFQVLLALILAYGAYHVLTKAPKMEPAFQAPPEDKSLAEKLFSILATFFEDWGIILERHERTDDS
jgi:hypothetical protein